MKRVLFVILALALVLTSCAPKTQIVEVETEKIVVKKPLTIQWFTELGGQGAFEIAQEWYRKSGVNVEVILTASLDGTTSDIDAKFASGDPPDVYTAYGGRVDKFYDVAVPLSLDESVFIPGMLDLGRNSKGQVVFVPCLYWIVGGGINIDLVNKYGLNPANLPGGPDRTWTIQQFEALAAEFKSKAPVDEFATMVFAANGSGDYYVLLNEAGLGAHPLYDKAGKFDVKPLVGAWSTFKVWLSKGYVPPGVSGLSDDHYISARGTAKLLFFGMSPNAVYAYNYEYVSYPSLDGSFVPPCVAPSGHIALQSGNAEKEAASKAFVEFLAEPLAMKALGGEFPTRLDAEAKVALPATIADGQKAAIMANVDFALSRMKAYGVLNMGIQSPHYQEIRTLRVTKLGEAMDGKKTVEQAVAEFQAEGDAILSK